MALAIKTHRSNIVRGPLGNIPVRIYYPATVRLNATALVYAHDGGYTVGDVVDVSENELTILAGSLDAVILGAEYRLTPRWIFMGQLDESLYL